MLHISELEGVGVSVTGLIFSEKLKEAPDEILIKEELFEGRIEGVVVEVKGEGDGDEAVIELIFEFDGVDDETGLTDDEVNRELWAVEEVV